VNQEEKDKAIASLIKELTPEGLLKLFRTHIAAESSMILGGSGDWSDRQYLAIEAFAGDQTLLTNRIDALLRHAFDALTKIEFEHLYVAAQRKGQGVDTRE
jgi:hypothetical protein